MILVDTSVWIDFLRNDNHLLKEFLENGEVLIHPFIIGELSCGHLQKREKFLNLIVNLPVAVESTNLEVLNFINSKKLFGKGVGYIDLHILLSAILSKSPLWTLDKRLSVISKKHHSVISES